MFRQFVHDCFQCLFCFQTVLKKKRYTLQLQCALLLCIKSVIISEQLALQLYKIIRSASAVRKFKYKKSQDSGQLIRQRDQFCILLPNFMEIGHTVSEFFALFQRKVKIHQMIALYGITLYQSETKLTTILSYCVDMNTQYDCKMLYKDFQYWGNAANLKGDRFFGTDCRQQVHYTKFPCR